MRDSTKNPHHDVSRDPAILRSLGKARAARSLLTNAKCERPVKRSGYRSRPEVTSRLPNEAFDSSAKQHFSYPGRFVRFSTCGAGSNAALLDEVPERVTRRLRCRSWLGMRPGIFVKRIVSDSAKRDRPIDVEVAPSARVITPR